MGILPGLKKMTHAARAYVIEGTGLDKMTPVGVVGRFTGDDRYLIITVFEVTDLER
jgi:hypothetical protein